MYPPQYKVKLFRSTSEEFFTKHFLKSYSILLQFAWTSAEQRCVAYNELYRNSDEAHFFERFLSFHKVGGRSQTKVKQPEELIDDQERVPKK